MWAHTSRGRQPALPAPEPVRQRVTLLLIRERAEDAGGSGAGCGSPRPPLSGRLGPVLVIG